MVLAEEIRTNLLRVGKVQIFHNLDKLRLTLGQSWVVRFFFTNRGPWLTYKTLCTNFILLIVTSTLCQHSTNMRMDESNAQTINVKLIKLT